MMRHLLLLFGLSLLWSCAADPASDATTSAEEEASTSIDIADLLDQYAEVRLTADLSTLRESDRQMIPLLIEAAKIMDTLFWYEAYGERQEMLQDVEDNAMREYFAINYGPWDRLNDNEPFVAGVGPKPAGANFYPADMTKEEFEAAELSDKTSLYTFLRRNEAGELYTIPYHEQFPDAVQRASGLLRQAAALSEDPGLQRYLDLRAGALLADEYQPSDLAWMDMRDNAIDAADIPVDIVFEQGLSVLNL
jgi:hypothetical protein